MYIVIDKKQTKIVIEKSKFIAIVYPCFSVQNQASILKEIKKHHLSATHICYASVIYENGQVLPSFSDDREPSGTAGAQILQALKEQEFVNTLCVVVRYFGGIKLGISGLGRAYKESALSVLLDNKQLVVLKSKYTISCGFNVFNKIKPYLQENSIELINAEYTHMVTFCAYLSNNQKGYLQNLVTLTEVGETRYC